MNRKICIYHGGCDDGFAAAWIVCQQGLGYEFVPGVYQTDPPDVTDADVLLVDFSYKRPILEAMADIAKSVIVLDHHKTAQDDLAGIPEPMLPLDVRWPGEGLQALFDMERSGAGITWDYFNQFTPRPSFINYIEDRDLWKLSLPKVNEFTMALRSYPQDFEIWTDLSHQVDALISEGNAIHRYYRTLIDAFKLNATRAVIGGHSVPVVNTPFHFASELAGELAEHEQFAACYWFHGHGCTFSLRSREGGTNVGEIAKIYGGGGHPGAAGFKLGWASAWELITGEK